MLKIDNLHVSYGHIEVLKGISFSVEIGEIVALIGGNGAGKTTTLSTISGLVRPTLRHDRVEGRTYSECRRSKPSSARASRIAPKAAAFFRA